MIENNPNKILVVGPTGSGKSTLARMLSERHELPHVELDEFQWRPNWESNPDFQTLAEAAINKSAWVLEGGYIDPIQKAWPHADSVYWIDLPFLTVLRQLTARSIRRIRSRESICNGNHETVWTAFLNSDSLLFWLIKTYRKRRRLFSTLRTQYPEVPVKHIRSWETID
jgi:adenylate kinase family enzyme